MGRDFDAQRLCADHPRQELRRRTDAAGRIFYQHQCLDCGARVGVFVATAVALADGRQPPPFDAELFERGEREIDRAYEERRAVTKRREEEQSAAWWQRYNAYLLTDAWQTKRAQALARDGNVCQGCRQHLATQVHHRTYEHLGDELLFELISVCDQCHMRIHPHMAASL
jgi:hypothetical protein